MPQAELAPDAEPPVDEPHAHDSRVGGSAGVTEDGTLRLTALERENEQLRLLVRTVILMLEGTDLDGVAKRIRQRYQAAIVSSRSAGGASTGEHQGAVICQPSVRNGSETPDAGAFTWCAGQSSTPGYDPASPVRMTEVL